MPCLWCKENCGDRDFCDSDCYEAYEKAQDEYADFCRKSECDALLGEHDGKPFNENFGSKGNN